MDESTSRWVLSDRQGRLYTSTQSLSDACSESVASRSSCLLTSSFLAPPSLTILEAPAGPSLSNGTNAIATDIVLTNDDAPYDSDSVLSDVAAPVRESASPTSSPKEQAQITDGDDDAASLNNEAQDASEDADFDLDDEINVPDGSVAPAPERSPSEDSQRPTKRKHAVEDDEHILANPELYGLRRSVRASINNITRH